MSYFHATVCTRGGYKLEHLPEETILKSAGRIEGELPAQAVWETALPKLLFNSI